MKRYQTILLAGAIVAAFGAVGTMDAEDERREFAHYCAMVGAGHWPDYRNLVDSCPELTRGKGSRKMVINQTEKGNAGRKH